MGNPAAGWGGTFSYKGSAVVNIRNIDGPDLSRPKIDVTAQNDTHKRYMAGRPDSGELEFEANFNRVDHSALIAELSAAVTIDPVVAGACILTYKDGSSFTFQGFVLAFKPKADGEGQLIATVRIAIDGPVTHNGAGA